MAGIQYFGQAGKTGTATGSHLHTYVKELSTGKYLNPATIRTPLLGVRLGENRVPALIKDEKGNLKLNPEAGITLTSDFGPRSAPTKGASTYHQGEDWAVREGTPVYYEGAGQFVPKANQGGFGNLATLITPDKKYEIGFGHMKSLGGPSSLAPAATKQSDQESAVNTLLDALFRKEEKKEPSLSEQLVGQAVAQSLQSGPQNFLQKYAGMLSDPYEGVILNPAMLG
jgi:hypothetical protein